MEWVSVAAAAASCFFAGWSWWRSNVSKTERRLAEDARARAERHVGAAEDTAVELRKLAKRLEGPPLVGETANLGADRRIWLRNDSAEPVTVTEILNEGEFARLDSEVSAPFTIPPWSQVEMSATESLGHSAPSTIHLRLDDGGELHVALRPRR